MYPNLIESEQREAPDKELADPQSQSSLSMERTDCVGQTLSRVTATRFCNRVETCMRRRIELRHSDHIRV